MARDTDIQYLTEDEALALAATVMVGRVGYSRYSMPAIHLVNFVLDGRDVIFRTRKGAKFAAAVADTVVAFEVDEFDPATRSGWTATLVGRSRLVTDPEEEAGLARLGLETWLPHREYFVRIRTEMVTGRRIEPSQLHADDVDFEGWPDEYL